MILVVGATGQLGSAVVRKGLQEGLRVRALVRPGSRFEPLRAAGADIAMGDLRDVASLRRSLEGVSAVIATATVVFPRGAYAFAADEGRGYENLLSACRERDVEQFIFTSIARFPERYTRAVPTLRWKRHVEGLAIRSGVPYTIFRPGPFMDDYLIGSRIPLRGAEYATLRRPFWLSRLYLERLGSLVEERGVALVPGRAGACHSFIALDDVATFLLRALGDPAAHNACIDLGGPQDLSWNEVAGLYAKLLGRSVRAIGLRPSLLLRLASTLLGPFSEAAANQLGILWCLASREVRLEGHHAADLLGVRLTTAERFLEHKISLPDDR
ncbi:MAG: SDR family oxidoreductase [Myxococcota bacterium]